MAHSAAESAATPPATSGPGRCPTSRRRIVGFVVCGLLVVLAAWALLRVALPGCFGPKRHGIIVCGGNMGILEVSTQYLGQHLAAKYPGAKAVVIIMPPSKFGGSARNYLLEGLKKGLAGQVEILAEISPEIPRSSRVPGAAAPAADGASSAASPESGLSADDLFFIGPPEFWLTADVFDTMLQPYIGKVDLVITTIGLPTDMVKLKFWTLNPRPKLVIACGSIFELRKAIADKSVVAAVTYNPKAVYERKVSLTNVKAAFDKRFLLVTPENVEEISRKYPELFYGETGNR